MERNDADGNTEEVMEKVDPSSTKVRAVSDS